MLNSSKAPTIDPLKGATLKLASIIAAKDF